MVARKYREIIKNAHQVDDVRKVRSFFMVSKPKKTQRERIGEKMTLETEGDVEVAIRAVVDYYFGLRVLGNARAKVGNHQAPSSQRKGEQAQYSDLSENIDYADWCLRHASEKGLGATEALKWMEEMDSLTQGTMVHYMRRK